MDIFIYRTQLINVKNMYKDLFPKKSYFKPMKETNKFVCGANQNNPKPMFNLHLKS